jgi:hypothetical protein
MHLQPIKPLLTLLEICQKLECVTLIAPISLLADVYLQYPLFPVSGRRAQPPNQIVYKRASNAGTLSCCQLLQINVLARLIFLNNSTRLKQM